MRARQAVFVAHLFGRVQQRRGEGLVLKQQARARGRGEGRGDLELGIIAPARPLVSVGPALVEHVFAAAVRLEVGRQSRVDRAAVVRNRDRCSLPAGARRDAARILHRREERVADEGIVLARNLIPRRRVDTGDPAVDACRELSIRHYRRYGNAWGASRAASAAGAAR